MLDRYLADCVMIIHIAFIAFVGGGAAVTLLGAWMNWVWVRNRWFRGAHLACVALIMFQQWRDLWCPLTLLENHLRRSAGQSAYTEGFIAYWLQRIVDVDYPDWFCNAMYAGFAVLVLLLLWLAPIQWRKRPGPTPDDEPLVASRITPEHRPHDAHQHDTCHPIDTT